MDEEGGTVARIGRSGRFAVPQIEDMSVIGASKDISSALEIGNDFRREN